MAFIRGSTYEPFDENSKKLVGFLKERNINFEFFNIDADKEVFQYLIDLYKV